MFSYRAYGLGIHSEFPLPEFLPVVEAGTEVTIRLEYGEPPAYMLAEDSYVELHPREAILGFKRAGVFRIRDGCEITVSTAPGADLSLVRLYLLGKVFATLLYQRGLLVLHASAVEINGQAVCFLGTSYFGKSSVAASLHRVGCGIVADDVTAVDLSGDRPLAIPAFPQLKLDPRVAQLLGYDMDSLVGLHPLEPRRGLRVADDGFDTTPLPIGLMYLLGPDAPSARPFHAQHVLIELVGNSFPARLNRSGGASHLRQCAQLAKLAPALRLGREASRAPSLSLRQRICEDLCRWQSRGDAGGLRP